MRCAVSVLLACAIATCSGIGHSYWAMVAAVVPLTAHLPAPAVDTLPNGLRQRYAEE